MSNQTINTVFGAGLFGESNLTKPYAEGQPQQYVDILKKNGFKDYDTAQAYGTSEHVIGLLKPDEQGLIIDTKVRSMEPGSYSKNRQIS